MKYNWLVVAFLQGIWNISNRLDPVFTIKKDIITTHAESAIFTMKPTWREQQVFLSDLKILKKPDDWMNIFKYRQKIHYYHQIKEHGLLLNISFLNDSCIRIQTKLLDENLDFYMERKSL